MYTSQSEDAEYECDKGILQFFIQNQTFGHISPKTKILFNVLENLYTSKLDGNKNEHENNILRFYI